MTDPSGQGADSSLNLDRLEPYLRDRLPRFGAVTEVRKFQGGQSNPTFRISTSSSDYVLRKKPAGNLLPSAHAIDREFAVMRAVSGPVPVPEMHLYCDDESVIGQAFYIMEYVEGRVMPDARLLEAPREERRALSLELVRILARLHCVDYESAGLNAFGRPAGYIARQLARWTKQYAASRVEPNADMDRLIPWLEENMPGSDESAIVHGDYRSHNVIFMQDQPRIAAVLDWELATIGHPLADLAYCCLPYYLPADDMRGFHGEAPQALGIPPEEELVAAYCREAGRSEPAHWRYFIIFSLFRSAAILAGVYKRAFDGTASSDRALEVGKRYRGTAACAWGLAENKTSNKNAAF